MRLRSNTCVHWVDAEILVTKMFYWEENILLVFGPKNTLGCRILINYQDLIKVKRFKINNI